MCGQRKVLSSAWLQAGPSTLPCDVLVGGAEAMTSVLARRLLVDLKNAGLGVTSKDFGGVGARTVSGPEAGSRHG
jgi:hypothetical protein